jgi:hypothetical protein
VADAEGAGTDARNVRARRIGQALRQRLRWSPAFGRQIMRVPAEVQPTAPAVEQNAPGCTMGRPGWWGFGVFEAEWRGFE